MLRVLLLAVAGATLLESDCELHEGCADADPALDGQLLLLQTLIHLDASPRPNGSAALNATRPPALLLQRPPNATAAPHGPRLALLAAQLRATSFGSVLPAVIIVFLFVIFVVVMAGIVDLLWNRFSTLKDLAPDLEATFPMYLRYRFQRWITTGGETSKVLLVLIVCLVFIYTGTLLYCLAVHDGVSHSFWRVYKMLMDPAQGYAEGTVGGKAVGILMSVGFLFILALLVAIVQDSVTAALDGVRLGFTPVIEARHILLVGFTEDTCEIIQELCNGYEPEGGTTIVILAEEPKDQVHDQLHRASVDLLNSKVVVRSGNTHSLVHLEAVSAASCHTVILSPSRSVPREGRDNNTLQMLLAMAGKGWPIQGRILAICCMPGNMELFRKIGGHNIDVVNVEDFMGKLMVQCSRQPGIGEVVNSVLSFEGCEFYVKPVPKELIGKTFGEAMFYYENCILAGTLEESDNIRSLAPDMGTILCPAHELVLFAEDANHTEPLTQPLLMPRPVAADAMVAQKSLRTAAPQKETIFILGWNEVRIGVVLLELEETCAAGSKVVIMAEKPIDERQHFLEKMQKRAKVKFSNLKFEFAKGRLGHSYSLQDLPVPLSQASRVFVLADGAFDEGSHAADNKTMSTVVMVKDLLQGHANSKDLRMVPEIREAVTGDICDELQIKDMIDTAALPARIIATIAHAPKLKPVLMDLISEHGNVKLKIQHLSSYVDRVPTSISFVEAMRLVAAHGDVLLGWSYTLNESESSRAFHDRLARLCGSQNYGWEMNPEDKMTARDWEEQVDKVVVLAPAAQQKGQRGRFFSKH